MPWNEPGRGGGNGKDPWKGGGQQPPDLDEVFANVQKRLKKIIGGSDDSGGGGGSGSQGSGGPGVGGIIALVLVLAGIWTAWNSVHIVDESERGVVLRFGEYTRIMMPGLRFTFPAPIETITKVNVAEVRSQENQARMLTSDENLIELGFAVQYRVLDPAAFLFEIQAPETTLAEASDSAIREVVGTNQMDFILEQGRGEIATAARDLLQQILERYDAGIEILTFNLQQVRPPNQVQAAFDDVVRAREDQVRFANEAQAYANQEIPEARGRAARVREQAQGYRDSVIAQAEGEADRFIAVYEEYAKAPQVTRQRLYLQELESLYSGTPKVLLDANSSNNLLYLPLDRLASGQSNDRLPPPPLMSGQEREGQATGSSQTRTRSGREGR
ncbi:MAG: FtsH protease activity modulator HflK [Wenzhouxiangellaceae bacterium]|nr:FtsH protease activity modulator HflK [Wenzhouxiangellaceae bacterium]MBS3746323.1 FtsH protease activity modulator HflK [Wenzhouxiangellaceae bacterium]MBS3823083.1 FtsH protease activity modulator HflK [Wenzhouxiangellaceae bacterium]